MHIHFVCTGNLCRSPMAEALLRHGLAERGCNDVRVTSSGTWAGRGGAATPDAVRILKARGIDLSSHRTSDFDPAGDADLIVAMTSVHVREILDLDGELESRLRMMKELPELDIDLPAGGTPSERLRALLDTERPAPRRDLDVGDPYGLLYSAYERTVRDLEAGIEVLVQVLCPRSN
jgi:protein-tyrosine phosphatase